MKEIKFYPDRSYATKIISNGSISLEDAIYRCKQSNLPIVLILKDTSDSVEYIQMLSITSDDIVKVSEQNHHYNQIVSTWINTNIHSFIEQIKGGFPHLEGYLIESFQDLVKIIEVNAPRWMS